VRGKTFEALVRAALRAAIAACGLATLGANAQEPAPRREPARPLSCEPRRSEDRIDGVTERGEIRLGSGRLVKIAGIRRPEEPGAEQAATTWLSSFGGSPVEISALASEPDRWSRLLAMIRVASDAGPIDLGRGLVAAGLAVVDAGEADRLCQPELLEAEQRARELRLGLWRSDRYKPIAAAEVEMLRGRAGQFALIEGRIRSVGERRQRTYLNFGADWNADFTITIPQRTWRSMRERGLSAVSLKGRRVRARGMIEEWRGPAMTIVAPEMIEILDEDNSRRR
jgi:endonuclease YncB( thermonuclease family)